MIPLDIVRRLAGVALVGALLALAAGETPALDSNAAGATVVAQGQGTEPRDLQPRYQPVPPEPEPAYNSSYIFALTRGVADSTMHVAAKASLFIFTVPLDLVFLPIATIGGFFG